MPQLCSKQDQASQHRHGHCLPPAQYGCQPASSGCGAQTTSRCHCSHSNVHARLHPSRASSKSQQQGLVGAVCQQQQQPTCMLWRASRGRCAALPWHGGMHQHRRSLPGATCSTARSAVCRGEAGMGVRRVRGSDVPAFLDTRGAVWIAYGAAMDSAQARTMITCAASPLAPSSVEATHIGCHGSWPPPLRAQPPHLGAPRHLR
jgi:hypothetical protein